jgi:hypothetical protein
MSEEIDIFTLDFDSYDNSFHKWVISTYGKMVNDTYIYKKFDASIGLEYYNSVQETELDNKMQFIVKDKKKLFLARLKYSF